MSKLIKSPNEIELFTKQYEFLDDILLIMQNSPATNLTHEIKCQKVSWFLHNCGFCCIGVNDYVKAIALPNQAIATYKIALGDKSNNFKSLAYSYNNLGFVLEKSNHLLEAKCAYQTSIEMKMQARNYENEEEINKCISITQNSLQREGKMLKNV